MTDIGIEDGRGTDEVGAEHEALDLSASTAPTASFLEHAQVAEENSAGTLPSIEDEAQAEQGETLAPDDLINAVFSSFDRASGNEGGLESAVLDAPEECDLDTCWYLETELGIPESTAKRLATLPPQQLERNLETLRIARMSPAEHAERLFEDSDTLAESLDLGARIPKQQPIPTAPLPDTWSIADVWEGYLNTRDDYYRNILMLNYRDLARYSAERAHTRLPDKVSLDDLIMDGLFGLKDALENYDPERGVKFETYCAPRIKGAILDGLRARDWVPRLARARQHIIDRAVSSLKIALGRKPTDEEIMEELGVDEEQFARIMTEVRGVPGVITLSTTLGDDEGGQDLTEADVIANPRARQPDIDLANAELVQTLLTGFSLQEQMIIELYYCDEFTMKEIGEFLNMSESRISQMHTNVRIRLLDTAERIGAAQGMTVSKEFIEDQTQASSEPDSTSSLAEEDPLVKMAREMGINLTNSVESPRIDLDDVEAALSQTEN